MNTTKVEANIKAIKTQLDTISAKDEALLMHIESLMSKREDAVITHVNSIVSNREDAI